MRTAIFLVVLVFGLAGTTIAEVTDDVYISAAKGTLVRDLDSDLPALPLEEWLRGLVGESARVVWEVNDCGEQTGTSADPERDLPTCAEAEASVPEKGLLHVRVSVGTVQHGILAERGLYAAYVQEGGHVEWFTRLSELANYVRTGKR